MFRLTVDLLLRAYASGIFPMAESRGDPDLFWVDPEWRGIIPLDDFHIPRRLRRKVRRAAFEVTANTAFERVMKTCAESAPDRQDSWINTDIIRAYTELHHKGYAHSIECWQDDGLVGGLYGVSLAAAFFGESMFTRRNDASKVALVHLMARLRKGGYELLDTQFTTRHLEQFGAVEISRADYHLKLESALRASAAFPASLSHDELTAFLADSS